MVLQNINEKLLELGQVSYKKTCILFRETMNLKDSLRKQTFLSKQLFNDVQKIEKA